MHAMNSVYPCNPELFFYHYLSHSNKPQKYMSIILSMAVKSFLDQNQLLHLQKHAGHRHSGVQVRFLKCVIIERPFNLLYFFFTLEVSIRLLSTFPVLSPQMIQSFQPFLFKSTVRNELGERGEKSKKKPLMISRARIKQPNVCKRILNS